ncbi:hypothetical protein APA_252 [Pseudanabaena sp. lw0831]|nr:hypothetical protein APA_252 [Pseudanabaena sp. lw0831]
MGFLNNSEHLQRFALKPEPRNFLKVLRRNTFKKFLGSFDRKLLYKERWREAPPPFINVGIQEQVIFEIL